MRHTFISLLLTLKSLFIAKRMGFRQWRYPLNHRVANGFAFVNSADLMELIVYNKIKHSRAGKFLERFGSTVVLVAAVDHGRVWVNAYRLREDGPETDLLCIHDPHQGANGRFNYVLQKRRLYHTKHLSSMIRGKGFLDTDPVFSLELPLTRKEMQEIGELMLSHDAQYNDIHTTLTTEQGELRTELVLEGEVLRQTPLCQIEPAVRSLGVLAEPV